MIARFERETQRAYVERVLRTERRLATYDALYNLTYRDGTKCSITRLAAIVCQLRIEGWNIQTLEGEGATAIYRFMSGPDVPEAAAAIPPVATASRAPQPGRTYPDSRPAVRFGDPAAIREYGRRR